MNNDQLKRINTFLNEIDSDNSKITNEGLIFTVTGGAIEVVSNGGDCSNPGNCVGSYNKGNCKNTSNCENSINDGACFSYVPTPSENRAGPGGCND